MPNSRRFIFYAIVIIAVMISACNMPAGVLPAGGESLDLAATITAQALLLQSAAFTPTIEGLPASENGNQSGILPDTQPTATSTPQGVQAGAGVISAETATPSSTTVTVSVETNCRKGPSTSYTSVYSLPVGTIANVVGKNTSSGYWIISIPGNTNSTCWLWGKYATVSGNTNGLAEVAAPVQNTATATKPPTATLTAIIASLTPTNTAVPVVAAPAAPSNLNFAKTCINQGGGIYTYSGTFTWNDNSNNETGFNAYLSGPAFSNYSLPSNTTNLYINPDFPEANAVIFRVEAFNNNGASPSVQITITCP